MYLGAMSCFGFFFIFISFVYDFRYVKGDLYSAIIDGYGNFIPPLVDAICGIAYQYCNVRLQRVYVRVRFGALFLNVVGCFCFLDHAS